MTVDPEHIHKILEDEIPVDVCMDGKMRIDTSRWDDTTLEIDVDSIVSRIMELIKDA